MKSQYIHLRQAARVIGCPNVEPTVMLKYCSHESENKRDSNDPCVLFLLIVTGPASLGCYQFTAPESLVATVANYTKYSSSMSHHVCFEFCTDLNMPLAVLLYTECFCGNEDLYEAFDLVKRPDSECTVFCPGYKAEKCGGYERVNLFSLRRKFIRYFFGI